MLASTPFNSTPLIPSSLHAPIRHPRDIAEIRRFAQFPLEGVCKSFVLRRLIGRGGVEDRFWCRRSFNNRCLRRRKFDDGRLHMMGQRSRLRMRVTLGLERSLHLCVRLRWSWHVWSGYEHRLWGRRDRQGRLLNIANWRRRRWLSQLLGARRKAH